MSAAGRSAARRGAGPPTVRHRVVRTHRTRRRTTPVAGLPHELPFAVALRRAIESRGLGLDQIRQLLASRGSDVSVATLSYWQTGRRSPGRRTSFVTLAHLEDVLGMTPGALAKHIPPRGTEARAVNSVLTFAGAMGDGVELPGGDRRARRSTAATVRDGERAGRADRRCRSRAALAMDPAGHARSRRRRGPSAAGRPGRGRCPATQHHPGAPLHPRPTGLPGDEQVRHQRAALRPGARRRRPDGDRVPPRLRPAVPLGHHARGAQADALARLRVRGALRSDARPIRCEWFEHNGRDPRGSREG